MFLNVLISGMLTFSEDPEQVYPSRRDALHSKLREWQPPLSWKYGQGAHDGFTVVRQLAHASQYFRLSSQAMMQAIDQGAYGKLLGDDIKRRQYSEGPNKPGDPADAEHGSRCHYVKAKVQVHRYPDNHPAIFHGTRTPATYDALGKKLKQANKVVA
jgi:hypothetical protein